MTYVMVYLLIGAVGKLTELFGFEVVSARCGTENAFLSLMASMLAWPLPFAFYVKDNFFDE